ncbi:MAG: MotA/TolQ/ExbB proton channel family protein [Peptostreptococcaceae bacterium]
MNTIIINSITIVFVIVIILYSIINLVLNKALCNFIRSDYKNLNEDYQRSLLYQNIKGKYNKYIMESTYAEINISSFIEEMCTNFTYKNKGILDRIKSIKNSSSTCVLLGVLGTFVGLSIMLLSVNTNDIINSLPAAISSMQTAFITSICGIICSIMINIVISFNDCENTLVQLMLKLENLLTSEITHQKSQQIDAKIEDVKNTIKEISKSIESIERFDQISKDLNEFNNEFIGGIEILKGLLEGSQSSIKTFDDSIRSLDKQFSIINIKFTNLFDKYDMQENINKEILVDIKEASKYINESNEIQLKIEDYLNSVNSYFALYESNSQDLLMKLRSKESTIIQNQQNFIDQEVSLDNSIKDLSNVVDNLSKDISNKIELIFNYIDLYKEAVEMSSEEIYLTEDVADLNGVDIIND